MKHAWSRGEAWAKATAVILGSTVLYFALSAFLGRFLPVERSLAIALALLISIPSWVAVMVAVLLARSGTQAWAYLVVSTTVLFGTTLWARAVGT